MKLGSPEVSLRSAPVAGMHLLVSEFLCGGHWPEETWPESLLREGCAMLESVVQDLLALPDVHVATTWDDRLPLPELFKQPRVTVRHVCSSLVAVTAMQDLARKADAALVIAPEFDSLLEQQCRMLSDLGIRLLNCTPAAIHHCADKLAVFQTCEEQGIPTIPTRLIEKEPHWLPGVVKRWDGAGSVDMQRIDHQAQWTSWRSSVRPERFIEQPFLPGRSCSVATIFRQGKPQWSLPPAEQHLSSDGRFQYQGGTIPASQLDPESLCRSIEMFSRAVPGLQGYVGFDFLIPDQGGWPLLVDVNPRLCTSYLGYRSICQSNLAAWLIDPDRDLGPSFRGTVSFAAAGTCEPSAAVQLAGSCFGRDQDVRVRP